MRKSFMHHKNYDENLSSQKLRVKNYMYNHIYQL